ncbi:hypothetical protein FACS1894176_10300 [Bacteroidia bacterium]|nr:hypothetical protein FACS1894176_10300 [Bacteroidia bacterium]
MKKIIFTVVCAVSSLGIAHAQNNAIGLRIGYVAEVSLHHVVSSDNRLEVDLGWNFDNGANLTGIYQWGWNLSDWAEGFKWYAGMGAGAGIWKKDFAISAVGQVGIEYNFNNIPLQLTVDYRPGISLIPGIAGPGGDVALGVRYNF